MAFKQHTGKGMVPDDSSSMAAQWEAVWADCEQNLEDLEQSTIWALLQSHLPQGGRILEAGCGTGQWVRLLASKGYNAYGIDFSERTVRASKTKWPDLELVVGDLRSMPYQDGFFDGVMSLGAVEHDVQGPSAALAEMYRVLRSGGILFCTVPCHNIARHLGAFALKDWARRNRWLRRLKGYNYDSVFWQYLWTPREYAQILTNSGFEVIRLVPLELRKSLLTPPQSFKARIIRCIQKHYPWFTPHMIAGICRKP